MEEFIYLEKKHCMLLTKVPIDWKLIYPLLLEFDTCDEFVPLKGGKLALISEFDAC